MSLPQGLDAAWSKAISWRESCRVPGNFQSGLPGWVAWIVLEPGEVRKEEKTHCVSSLKL